jgi:hypothetical protein
MRPKGRFPAETLHLPGPAFDKFGRKRLADQAMTRLTNTEI